MEQLCDPEVCLSEPTLIDWFKNEMQEVTTNKIINHTFENTNHLKSGECTKDDSLTQMEFVFESDNIQERNVFEDSKTICNDLRNVIDAKKLLKKGWCFVDEYSTEMMDFKRENNSPIKPSKHDNMTVESIESSPKKYASLSVTVSESLERKVVEQSFDLDFTIDNHFDKFTTTENKEENDNKPEFENEKCINNLKDIVEKPNSCEPLLKQLTPKPEDELNVDTEEFELAKSDDLLLWTIPVTGSQSDETGSEDFWGSESDSDSDEVLRSQHPNRRLQVDRPSESDLDSANKECKTQRNKHLHLEQRKESYKRKRRASSFDTEVKKSFGTDQKCPLSNQIKRPKLNSHFKSARKTEQKKSAFKEKSKSGEFWSEVLSTPDLWKTETNKINIGTYHKVDFEIDYCELLNRYVSCSSVKKQLDNECFTLWEERFVEESRDPNHMYYLMELHIPPAQMEVLSQQLTDKWSDCVECLRKVCENRRWPQPVYKLVPQSDVTAGFRYSCQLKCVQFTPPKPASNHKLAQELAAEACLDWLGLCLPKPLTSRTGLSIAYSVAPSHSTATATN